LSHLFGGLWAPLWVVHRTWFVSSPGFKALERILVGLTLRGELEPSNALVDKFVDIHDSGELRFVKWEEYTKRSQELKGVRKEELWKEGNDGHLKRCYKDGEAFVTVKDELSLKNVLQRRGLAMHIAKLLSFKVHESLINMYFEEMGRDDLPGYNSISFAQIRAADKEIFARLADKTRCGFSGLGDPLAQTPILPLDDLWPRVMVEPRVVALLLPLASSAPKQAPQQAATKRGGDELERLKEEVKKLRQQGKGVGKNGKDKGKKGKGSNAKKEKRGPRVPEELRGMATQWEGKPICYNYNLAHGCSEKGVTKCNRGLHNCALPGCGGPHSLQDCDQRGKRKGF